MIVRLVPWVTLGAAMVFFLTPFGWDLIDKSLNAGEQLARSLTQLVLFSALGIVGILALIEVAVRVYLNKRHAKGVTGV